jgi:hypothetical protein
MLYRSLPTEGRVDAYPRDVRGYRLGVVGQVRADGKPHEGEADFVLPHPGTARSFSKWRAAH